MPLNPNLLEQLRLANTPPSEVAVKGLGDLAAEAAHSYDNTAEGKELQQAGASPLDQISDPGTKRAFETGLENTTQLFDRLGLMSPSADELKDSGIDFAMLGAAYEDMDRQDLKPQVVLAPVLPLTGEFGWIKLFKNLSDDHAIPDNPLKGWDIGGAGLWIDGDTANRWDSLARSITPNPDGSVENSVIQTLGSINPTGNDLHWQLSIISGSAEPVKLNRSKNEVDSDTSYPYSHPNIPAYFTMQANLIQNGEKPADDTSYTWLAETLGSDDGAVSVIGHFSAYSGQVSLFQRLSDLTDRGVGVRPTVWG